VPSWGDSGKWRGRDIFQKCSDGGTKAGEGSFVDDRMPTQARKPDGNNIRREIAQSRPNASSDCSFPSRELMVGGARKVRAKRELTFGKSEGACMEKNAYIPGIGMGKVICSVHDLPVCERNSEEIAW
jgi:hypothetical protein